MTVPKPDKLLVCTAGHPQPGNSNLLGDHRQVETAVALSLYQCATQMPSPFNSALRDRG